MKPLTLAALLLLCGCSKPKHGIEYHAELITNVVIIPAPREWDKEDDRTQPKTDRERMFFEDGARWAFIAVTRGGARTLVDVVPIAYEMKREGTIFNREQEKKLEAARKGAPLP